MSIALASAVYSSTTVGHVDTVLPAGNYSIQEMQVVVTGVDCLTTTSGNYQYSAHFSSGGITVMSIIVIGISDAAALQLNANFSQSFIDPMLLSPNAPLLLTVDSSNVLTDVRVLVNISGFNS